MTTENSPTKVIFRKWKKCNTIIAIFPEIPSCDNPYNCESWVYVGGHGACNPHWVISDTVLASPDEYAWDKEVLEKQYGYQLKVITRNRREFLEIREAEIARMAQFLV
jgi:hypothetical protein